MLAYHGRLRSSIAARFHRAKCAACHQCISRCDLPNQLLNVSPVSCGGIVPAHWIAVRYSESTMRRSSSVALSSLLPERSRVPASVQNRCQWVAPSDSVAATDGNGSRSFNGEKANTHSRRELPFGG